MRGRKPKSTEEKLLTGNPGQRPLNSCRPNVVLGVPRCPEYFGEVERAIWDETLNAMPEGVLSPAYRQLIITFVEQVMIRMQSMGELRRQAEERRKPDGTTDFMTVETERGWVKNPLITVIDSTAKNIRSLASELGLSPASRERLKTSGNDPNKEKAHESPLKKFLGKKADKTARIQ